MANEYPVEASTTIKSPIDWAKVNPVGAQETSQGGHPLIQASREGMMKGTEDLARSLEERFAQPNWLKVSAAFAKPQLGGFGASFGSAMNELGAQEEARRSIAPTVARLNAPPLAVMSPRLKLLLANTFNRSASCSKKSTTHCVRKNQIQKHGLRAKCRACTSTTQRRQLLKPSSKKLA